LLFRIAKYVPNSRSGYGTGDASTAGSG